MTLKRKEHTPEGEMLKSSRQSDYSILLRELSSDTHIRKILEYLIKHGSITPAEAVDNFNCWRLGARISDLRRKGVKIITLRVENIHNNGTHARYVLDKQEGE